MKVNFTQKAIAISCVLSAAWLLSNQTFAAANPESPLTPAQAQRLSRDLVPSNSQDFFRQGQLRLQREIQRLTPRQNASTESPLKIKVNPQAELDRLPQLQPTPFQ